MSFGFAIGDFITAGELAWNLYRGCYKAAHGAPQEFQLLVGEVSTLSNSITILREEVENPNSALVKAGEDRVRMVNTMIGNISVTLKALEKVAKKFDALGSNSKRRLLWGRFKWSVELTSIDALRSKLVYHNTVMNLLLTSVGNSSLQRIESSTHALEDDVRAIKSYITDQQTKEHLLIPSVSAIDDNSNTRTLHMLLMQNAEATQPWSTIGVDQWIESGRWWLLKSQEELRRIVEPGQFVPLESYTCLVKASWILVDIIACHPQVPFLPARMHSEVQMLSSELKIELQRLKKLDTVMPDLGELESQDLRIWESQTKGTLLRPHPSRLLSGRRDDQLSVEGREEAIFQCFVMLQVHTLPDPIPCIAFFLVDRDNDSVRLLAQSQDSSVVMVISLDKEMQLKHYEDGKYEVNGEQITFTRAADAQMLCTLFETANFYYTGEHKARWTIDDFKALVLMTIIKNKGLDVAKRWSEKLLGVWKIDPESPVSTARCLVRDLAEGVLKENHFSDCPNLRTDVSLLRWAMECDYVGLSLLLISRGALYDSDWLDISPLLLSCKRNQVEITNRILQELPQYIDVGDPQDGLSPLIQASINGNLQIVRLLLQNGAKIDRQNRHGKSALRFATKYVHVSVLQLLIDNGADIHQVETGGDGSLAEACIMKEEEIITILVKAGAKVGRREFHTALYKCFSIPTFELIASRYYARTRPAKSKFPKRLAKVTVEAASTWVEVYLDDHAQFEHPDPMPPNVRQVRGKFFECMQPQGTAATFFEYIYTCNVWYESDTLSYTVNWGIYESSSSGPVSEKGHLLVRIQNENGEESILAEGISEHHSTYERRSRGTKIL